MSNGAPNQASADDGQEQVTNMEAEQPSNVHHRQNLTTRTSLWVCVCVCACFPAEDLQPDDDAWWHQSIREGPGTCCSP